MTLNIAWITSRKDSCFDWFIESLMHQLAGDFSGVRVIVVDFWMQPIPHLDWTPANSLERLELMRSFIPLGLDAVFTAPKPTPWQGPHRLSKHDYFAASNARNTALCFAKDGHIAYVDDLSVLLPSWLPAVRKACDDNRITAGAFKKLLKLVVVNGVVKSFDPFPPGVDSRLKASEAVIGDPLEAPPNWLFGCSAVAPVERFLEVNGWPEMCDSMGLGLEDCHMGIAFSNRGNKLWYDRRMLTYESEERHYGQFGMMRVDKRREGTVTISPGVTHPDEKGHHLVRILSKATRFTNYFEAGGIRSLRNRILAGEPFPIIVLPEHDWHDRQPISEL